jgi:arylsulfatase A-like enzyme/Tfp pilus assembly protein PilF
MISPWQRRVVAIRWVALVQALALLSGCDRTPSSSPTQEGIGPSSGASVLLITIDTLRADRLSAQGPMPHLRSLASRGTTFTNARSPVPLTLPSHATVLTGLGPQSHQVRDNIGYVLSQKIPTVTEALANAGYATGAFVGGYPLDRTFGLARAFEVYGDEMTRTPPAGRSGHTERRADEVVEAAIEWLSAEQREPFFLWVHFFDPHDPYEAPPAFAGEHDHPYDDEVAYADHALGRLIEWLDTNEVRNIWFFIAADHGESLGEHGEATHGVFLYESTLRVPLVIVPPDGLAAEVVEDPVSLTDLAPTMLEAVGLPPLPASDGRSLIATVSTGALDEPAPLYVESIHGRRRYGWSVLSGFLDWPSKFIAAPTPELYDVARDPSETDNLYSPRQSTSLERRLDRIRGETGTMSPEDTLDVDLERLNSLGYLGGSSVAAGIEVLEDRPRPDPKDRIAALAPTERGLSAIAKGRYDDARRELGAALDLDPDNLVALNNLGIIALQEGDLERAVGFFTEGLRKDPAAENIANNLGLVLARQGRHEEAAAAYRRAIDARPGFAAARFNLAIVLHRQGNHDEALRELEWVRANDPDFPELPATMEQVRKSRSEGSAEPR